MYNESTKNSTHLGATFQAFPFTPKALLAAVTVMWCLTA